MTTRSIVCLAALLLGAGTPLHAQTSTPDMPPAPSSNAAPAVPGARPSIVPVLGASLGSLAIDRDRAATAQVGDRAFGVQFDAALLVHRFFTIGVDFGGQILRDHAKFTQNTTLGEKQSTSNVTYLSAFTGVRTSAFGRAALAASIGATASMTRRSIDNCVDCHVDKLSIPGGVFAEPALLIAVRSFEVRLTDRVYLAKDGMKSIIAMGAQLPYHPRH